jgi:Holliday junction resolvasome RuvABC endonuclease subunit
MTVINWPKDIGLLELKIKPHADLILTGTVLAVDPSSGSRTSQPGWAFFSEAEYLMGGTLHIDHKNNIYQRLIDLYKGLSTLTDTTPDVMVIEKVHVSMSSSYLQWAIGVSIAAVQQPLTIEVLPHVWKSVAKSDKSYTKTDENDARMMGRTVIEIAKRCKRLQEG